MNQDILPVPLLNEVLVDLTNFVARPLRTGIQRYFTEIFSNWPDNRPLLPFILEEGGKIAVLHPDIFAAISGYIRAQSRLRTELFDQRIRHFRDTPLCRVGIPDLIAAKAVILPEITYDSAQLAFYEKAVSFYGEKIVLIAHDFIPWLRPDLYPDLDFGASGRRDYVSIVQKARSFAFNSHKTKKDAEERILRRQLPDSLVLGGGADGLGSAGPVAADPPHIPEFVMVGTIQRRKQHFTVLDVCESLWRGGARFFLTFVGAAGDFLTLDERDRLDRLMRDSPWFRWEPSPLDSGLAEIMRHATATIYVSVEEGLGMPVLESLWLGIPVIASDTLPALGFVSGGGIRLVDPTRPGTLAETITSFLAPDFAKSVRAEIDRAALPTWRGVAARLQAWVERLPGLAVQDHVPARRRLEMIAAIHDLRSVPLRSLTYQVFTAVRGRAPTGSDLAGWLGDSGVEALTAVERMVEAAAAQGELSPAERSAWMMSIEAARTLPADFDIDPPDTAKAAVIDRAVALLRPLLGCPDERFLEMAYLAVLGRPPDPSGEADFRRFLSDHADQARWARGTAVKALVASEEGSARPGHGGLAGVIEDMVPIDLFSQAELSCFEHLDDEVPSRWLFARLIDLRTAIFLRFATALFQRRRVSEVRVEPPSRELSRDEKLDFLRNLYRDDEETARLIPGNAGAPTGAAAEKPGR